MPRSPPEVAGVDDNKEHPHNVGEDPFSGLVLAGPSSRTPHAPVCRALLVGLARRWQPTISRRRPPTDPRETSTWRSKPNGVTAVNLRSGHWPATSPRSRTTGHGCGFSAAWGPAPDRTWSCPTGLFLPHDPWPSAQPRHPDGAPRPWRTQLCHRIRCGSDGGRPPACAREANKQRNTAERCINPRSGAARLPLRKDRHDPSRRTPRHRHLPVVRTVIRTTAPMTARCSLVVNPPRDRPSP